MSLEYGYDLMGYSVQCMVFGLSVQKMAISSCSYDIARGKRLITDFGHIFLDYTVSCMSMLLICIEPQII